ncbi:hypothetical protein Q5752_006557 [Cryptotrichosporon argae]
MSDAFFAPIETRRSTYAISAESTIPDARLKEIVEKAVKHTPTSFNTQSSRAVVVTGAMHHKIWDIVFETNIKTLGGDEEKIAATKAKIDGAFRAGYGTVVFFEDQDVINEFCAKMPMVAQTFPIWSANSSGMLQFIVWTALEAEGLGANLQHYTQYNPETQAEITKALGVSPQWTGTAMLPFGKPVGDGGLRPKTFLPIEDRVKTFFD